MNKIAQDLVIMLFIILVCLFIYKQVEINNKLSLEIKQTQKSSDYNNVFIKDRDYYYEAIEKLFIICQKNDTKTN